MAGQITHRWDGTTLIVTSDSGTSSCDLKGSKGDIGIRGPQGRPGIDHIVNTLEIPGYAADAEAVGEALNTLQGKIINPNLLINGDFSVNQRGLTSYAMKDAAYSKQYTVDRWYIAGAAGTDKGNLAVEEGGVVFTSNIQYGEIGQMIEDYKLLRGKTVTLSCKVSNATQLFRLLAYTNQTQLASCDIESEVASVTFTIPNDIQDLRVLINSRTAESSSIKIHYIKLEVGSIATPCSPRPYAEELAICKRYYEKKPLNTIYKFARTTSQFYDPRVYHEVEKRTNPTVTIYSENGTSGCLSAGETDVTVSRLFNNIDGFSIQSTNSDFIENYLYKGYYEADAEMY